MRLIEFINFNAIYSELKEKKLPIRVVYKLSKLGAAIEKETAFYQEQLAKIISDYAERNENNEYSFTEDGNGVKIQPEKLAACQEEVNALDLIEVELPNIHFTLDELDNLELTVEQMHLLLPFIEEE